MTDTTTPKIIVNANPNVDVIQAFIRQLITVAGVALGALGLFKAAGIAQALMITAGPLASLIAMGWGLWKSHNIAAKAATMASDPALTYASTK